MIYIMELSEEDVRRIIREEIEKSRMVEEEEGVGENKEEEKEGKRDIFDWGLDAGCDIVEGVADFVGKGAQVFRILKRLRRRYGPKISDFLDEGTPISLTGKHLKGILFAPREEEGVKEKEKEKEE